MKQKIIGDLIKSTKRGLFHIVGASVLHNIIVFSISLVLVRILSKTEMGQFSYARNIINMLYIIGGLGIESGIMQFCTRADETGKRSSYLRFGIKIEIWFGLVLGFGILIFTHFVKLPVEGSTHLLRIMAFLPLAFHLFQAGLQYLRSLFWNRAYAYMNLTNSSLMLIFAISGAILFSVEGASLFIYFSFIISATIAFILFRREMKLPDGKINLTKPEKRGFLSYSVTAMLTNSVSQILFLIDTFLIGLIITTPETVATYKIATVIPFAINFIPKSMLVFVFPYLIKNKDQNLRKMVHKIQLYLGMLNILIVVFLITLAPWIIRYVFGPEYMDAVVPFRILSIGYFISGTFRVPIGNTIASQLKIKYNLIVGIVTTILHVCLDIWLISSFGIVGASIATVSAITFSVILSAYFLYNKVLPKPVAAE